MPPLEELGLEKKRGGPSDDIINRGAGQDRRQMNVRSDPLMSASHIIDTDWQGKLRYAGAGAHFLDDKRKRNKL